MTQSRLPLWIVVGRTKDSIDEIVTHVNRAHSRSRQALAKDDLTIAYLDAGRRLFEKQVSGELEPNDNDPSEHPLFRWMTRDSVFAEVRRGPDALPRQPSEGSFRDRWRSKGDYVADLIAYLYWTAHWALHHKLATEAASQLLDAETPFAEAIEEVAYMDLELTIDSQYSGTFRAQATLQPSATEGNAVGAGMRELYREGLLTWGATYQRLLNGRGMRLRPGISVEDFAVILTAVAEGLSVRGMVDGKDRVRDSATRTSLLGMAGMAILSAFVDPGDGRTLSQVVNDLGIEFPPRPSGNTPSSDS